MPLFGSCSAEKHLLLVTLICLLSLHIHTAPFSSSNDVSSIEYRKHHSPIWLHHNYICSTNIFNYGYILRYWILRLPLGEDHNPIHFLWYWETSKRREHKSLGIFYLFKVSRRTDASKMLQCSRWGVNLIWIHWQWSITKDFTTFTNQKSATAGFPPVPSQLS